MQDIRNIQIIVYNKREPIQHDCNKFHNVQLNNVGKEGHTFATHILNYYDNLSDYTIFLQGYPFDHCKDVINIFINSSICNKNFHEDYIMLSHNIRKCTTEKCESHRGIPLKKVYDVLFPESTTCRNISFGPGAQMIVSKNRIHSYSLDMYTKIVDMLSSSKNPSEGYVIERYWSLLFHDEQLQFHNEYRTGNKNATNSKLIEAKIEKMDKSHVPSGYISGDRLKNNIFKNFVSSTLKQPYKS